MEFKLSKIDSASCSSRVFFSSSIRGVPSLTNFVSS
jgi:hypothetical protein